MMTLVAALAVFLLLPKSLEASSCPQTPTGYFKSNVYTMGMPPDKSYKYINRPAGLNCSELNFAHQMCVKRINEYRTGARLFTNGQADPALGTLPELRWASGMDKCHSEISLSDFSLMGTCADGAHKNAWNCPGYGSSWGQNLCCIRTGGSLSDVLTSLYQCLQQMWDEGQDPGVGVDGHWLNMKSTSFQYVSCGFGFGTYLNGNGGLVLMTQNFGGSYNGQISDTSSGVATTVPPTTKPPTFPPTIPPPTNPPTTKPPKTRRG